ncbi:HlyD family efflux transporter periplasmic adaptor subunit [Eubacteriales bacterium OttesenSCG-928-M02]|nr:HlyD family efflux transporter periplasmic adaptor subunit [Eubacteriales bacterium OttesenSCG-928-M02]
MQAIRKRRGLIIGVLVVLIIAIAAVFLFSRGGDQTASAESIEMTATVTKGNIQNTVIGSGTLALEDGTDILLPSGLLVDQVLVKAGDLVAEGDALAVFDGASVTSAIAALQNTIKSTEQQINSTKNDTEASTIKTYVSGRVKKLYAEKDTLVTSTIAEYGSLALLSTDGLMAVDFSTEAELGIGDTVKVHLSDGAVKNGTVEKLEGKTYTVTLTDNGPKYDDAVTIKDGNGTEIGKGNLYIHKQVEITGGVGKVKTIHVKENGYISSGNTAITLTDLPASSAHQALLRQRTEYTALMQTLASMVGDNTLRATFSGTVQTVSLTAGTTTGSAGSGQETGAASSGTTEDSIAGLTISSHENMVLSVNVDELDILNIQQGQNASITLDAVEDKTYEGTITRIAETGSSEGGVTKYQVEISMERDENMRSGMNATATITIEEKNDILLLPVGAVQEFGNRVFVYTQKEGDTLGGEVEIETGLSNGLFVEVISGLSEGDTVYYNQALNTESGETMQFGNGMFPGGNMPSGGGMPGGGTMPEGGQRPQREEE